MFVKVVHFLAVKSSNSWGQFCRAWFPDAPDGLDVFSVPLLGKCELF